MLVYAQELDDLFDSRNYSIIWIVRKTFPNVCNVVDRLV